MTLFRLAVLVASLEFVASSFAQNKDTTPAADKADKAAERPAPEKTADAKPVMEITRSNKVNCEVKPVMTDEEIARCKKAWGR
jgi:hypothetical protein